MPKPYVPLGVNVMDDERIIDAGDLAELLFYRMLQVAKRLETDGVLSVNQIGRLHPKAGPLLRELHRVGLVRPAGQQRWSIAGWHDWNVAQESIDARRRRDKERQHAWRMQREAERDASVTRDKRVASRVTEPSRDATVTVSRNGKTETETETETERSNNYLVGTSSVLPRQGSAPRLRNAEPATLTGSLGAIVGGLR